MPERFPYFVFVLATLVGVAPLSTILHSHGIHFQSGPHAHDHFHAIGDTPHAHVGHYGENKDGNEEDHHGHAGHYYDVDKNSWTGARRIRSGTPPDISIAGMLTITSAGKSSLVPRAKPPPVYAFQPPQTALIRTVLLQV